MKTRVVITGIGMVTPLGNSVESDLAIALRRRLRASARSPASTPLPFPAGSPES